MKMLLLTLMLMLTSAGPVESVKQEFDETCHEGYEEYYVMDEYHLDTYSIKIVIGQYDQKVSHSVMFVSSNANEYQLLIQYENDSKYYEPKTNSRGDVLLYNIPCDKSVNLVVVKENVKTTSYTLTKINYSQFQENFTYLLNGEGNGLPRFEINDGTNSLIYILSLVFSIIIVLSIIVILVMYVKKQGMFNKKTMEERFEQEHQIKQRINETIINARNNIEVEAEEIYEEQPEEVKSVYDKPKYDFDEVRDISLILQEKGFNTQYKIMNSEEKNKVMLELMRMRDFKEISDEEYRSEVIKLWM